MKPERNALAWPRRGWMATTLLLALALLLHALAGFRGARAARDAMNRGQADLIAAALWERLASADVEADSLLLDRFLQSNAQRGLRYVALVRPGADQSVRAGDAIGDGPPPAQDSASGRIPLIDLGDRWRAHYPAPIGSPDESGAAHLVLEFEPRASGRLMRNARRTLGLALGIAVILSAVAWIFQRTATRYEDARLQLEQQRHLTQLGEMSAVLAHEIRNPLASLKGHAQLAVERLSDGTREKRCVEHVIGEANRLEALTTDLLSFARTGPLSLSPTNPEELVRMAGRDVFGDDRLTVIASASPPVWPLDADRVRQLLINLIENARQAAPGGRPVARLAQRSERLVFEIRDSGPGLPRGKEDRIFDAFFTTRASGTGLGLAVANRVAELHGGELRAENHPEGGAVFRLTIPRLEG